MAELFFDKSSDNPSEKPSNLPSDDLENANPLRSISPEIMEILKSGYLQSNKNPATVEGAGEWFKDNATGFEQVERQRLSENTQ